ncbi:pleiotropic drug resistance protein 3-like isoform X3 [Rhododendron vialii]|uniref:pleiotropic drug resistance protein 3-like isoform X3 n=1 Tax=Rhododendron vialii TaxID=182163 RepID=UPI00265EE34D|nr:pleiotropic drug resistance protein 3-like isoform X3 [Rhododendron vialii]
MVPPCLDSDSMAQSAGYDEIESLGIELAERGSSLGSSFQHHTSSFRSIEIEPVGIELAESGRSLGSSFGHHTSSFRSCSGLTSVKDDDNEFSLQCAEIDNLPTIERLRSPLFDDNDGSNVKGKRVVDVNKLGALERHMFVEKLIKHIENDNLRLLQKMRTRVDEVGVELPRVEVRYSNLRVEAECEVVHGKPLPTLWNSLKSIICDCAKLPGLKLQEAKITIINDLSGIVKPGRMTLLLGPPGCGKTTLLKALSGNLDKSLKVAGEVLYNGYKLEEFIPQKTSSYISQNDLHMPEMTVRETLDFSACCQGVGSRAEIMVEVSTKEKQAGVVPDPDIDTYMKAISVEGQKTTLQTDYMLKILGLDICADTLIGDAMIRGISGGQKKRLTTGELIIGPTKALFMDEISNGLDSSTAYQIVACLKQLAHISNVTILAALLQPAPEIFDLFDDIILMAEGKIVYHGLRRHVLNFFEDCGFRCPERKGVADFLQEVISRKDQAQYWHQAEQSWSYISVDLFCKKFKESTYGEKLDAELSKPFTKSQCHKNAISFSKYSLSKWALFQACMSREYLLMRRNSFVYVFKSFQIVIIAVMTMTLLLRTQMGVDVIHANNYLGALFFALVVLFFDGFPELFMTVTRLDVFYKQRDLYFYPAWSYAIPSTILKVPLSLFEALIWTSLTYYVIGYSPEPGRFFRQWILLFAVHFVAISMFRFVASVCRTMVASVAVGSMLILSAFSFSGFVIPKCKVHHLFQIEVLESYWGKQSSNLLLLAAFMPTWLKWGFWVFPLSYGEIGLVVNEFLAPRWQKTLSGNTTVGNETLESRGLNFSAYFFWLTLGALLGFAILFNIGFTLALTFLNSPGSRAIISNEKLSQIKESKDSSNGADKLRSKSCQKTGSKPHKDRLVLPFKPLTLAFKDVQYYVETPLAMKERGFTPKKLQLLCDITGALRPGVLTALMGVTGAGKTTLLDVIAGRKTSGTVEGDIRIGGYPKVQDTFARISGYCEQSDIHSPQITVEESVIYSAWLRLHPEIDSETKFEFVGEVLEIIELDEIRDCLVGMPGVSGLSTEQRKRLTIAVEIVANPSIIFMDEPTTGLDARAAAIVMRAVKNVADTGRTIVCTIHQPSIDQFEAFDELVLLKSGGHIIYCGPVGHHSNSVIKYFEDISGVPRIRSNYNPATWMLEVTSTTTEANLGINFAQVYKNSVLYQNNKALVDSLSTPSDTEELHFKTRFSQNTWGQFKSCLWKQYLSYWRSPSYNLLRSMYLLFTSLLYGILFWDQGRKINNQQSLFNILGAMFSAAMFLGINNSSSVLPYVSTERSVFYRERFAGMYGSWAYALAQVTIEVPYLMALAIVFSTITYPMIGYYWSAYKQFPKWWLWMYYLTPTSWTLNGMFTSQYGDVHDKIMVFGETKTVSSFLKDYFGYHHDQLPIVGVVLTIYPILFAFLFASCIEKKNFQKR